jgi:hypothetical protein
MITIHLEPLCHEFQIIKYPTVKIIRNGELIQKEYRGQVSIRLWFIMVIYSHTHRELQKLLLLLCATKLKTQFKQSQVIQSLLAKYDKIK